MRHPQYDIQDQVGYGQYSQVFVGVHRETGTKVALKRLDEAQLNIPNFLHELNLLVSLQHPHLVAFRGLEYINGCRYLIMDYYPGGTLRQLIEAPQLPDLGLGITLITQVLQGVRAMHQQGVIHCDLKPENILLSGPPQHLQAHVSDFGVARWQHQPYVGLSQIGDTGSPGYMAPERFYGDYSAASDLYAVGVILLELLVGERPFGGLPGEVMSAHLNQAVVLPDHLPFQIQSILRRSLQKLPQRRYQSADEMLAAVELAHTVLKCTAMGEAGHAKTMTSTHRGRGAAEVTGA